MRKSTFPFFTSDTERSVALRCTELAEVSLPKGRSVHFAFLKRLTFCIFLLVIIFFIGVEKSKGQNQRKIDSLETLLETPLHDTAKVNAMIGLGAEYSRSNPWKSYEIINTALLLSQKTNYKKGTASCFLGIGNYYFSKSDYRQALEYDEKALKLCIEIDDKKGIADCRKNIGTLYFYQGDYTKALEYYENSLKTYKLVKDKKGEASLCVNIGSIYRAQGNYPRALELYEGSLKLYEKLKDKNGMSKCYNNIGVIQYVQNHYPQSLDYFQKALKLTEELGDKKGMADFNNNIGNIYFAMHKYPQALEYHDKALKIYEILGDKKGMADSYHNMGNVYNSQGKYQQALTYSNKALEIKEIIGDKDGIASALNNIAGLETKLKNYDIALDYAQKSLTIAKEIGTIEKQKNAFFSLTAVYDSLGNTKEALRYYKHYTIAKDSLFSNEKQKQLTKMEAVYQNEKKQKEIELLSKDTELQKTEIKRQTTQKYAFIGGFMLMITLTFVIFRSYRQKQKDNKILVQQKEEIQAQKEELHTTNEQLSVTLSEVEVLNIELEKLSIVARETDNAVFIADKNGLIEWINQGSVKMYGNSILECIGKTFFDQSASPNIQSSVSRCINEKASVKYEAIMKSGSQRMFTQTTLTPIVNETGTVTKIIAIDSDITEIKEAEEKLEKQHTQILDSINFAKLIQDAILPSDEMIKKAFPESFVFFQPKDIVSGDFYWLHTEGTITLLVLADCTGHGVPGAFMSMIGNTLLNHIVKEKKHHLPSDILNMLNIEINNILNQSGQNYDAGMDVTACCIDYAQKQMIVSLAGQTIYFIKNGEIIEISEDLLSIGGLLSQRNNSLFVDHNIEITNNLMMYLSSDGYSDQFKGGSNTKFGSERFKQMLLGISILDMKPQKEQINKTFKEWKACEKQIDDITVIGIKL